MVARDGIELEAFGDVGAASRLDRLLFGVCTLRKRLWLLVTLSVLVVLFGTWLPSHSIIWNYKGWAIRVNEPDCNASRRHFFVEVQVATNGRGCSSAPLPAGWTFNEYRYVRSDGSSRHLPASNIAFKDYTPDGKIIHFFVGTEDELNKSWKSEPRDF
jgi:hypothetical protein